MTSKADFTTDEWNEVLQGAFVSGLAITAAEPSGLFGSIKEAFASASALAKAKSAPTSNELINSVVASLTNRDEAAGAREAIKTLFSGAKNPSDVKTRAISALARLTALLDRKAPSEAQPFKEWLLGISQSVAEASSEGGFLGFGGVKVSDAEKATITEISRALNLSA